MKGIILALVHHHYRNAVLNGIHAPTFRARELLFFFPVIQIAFARRTAEHVQELPGQFIQSHARNVAGIVFKP